SICSTEELHLRARRGCVRHCVGGEYLRFSVPLKDKPMVGLIPFNPQSRFLSPFNRPHVLEVERCSTNAGLVSAPRDESLHPQDFLRVRRGGLAHNGNASKYVVFGTSWRRGGSVEKEPEEPCLGPGYASEAHPIQNGRDRALCNL